MRMLLAIDQSKDSKVAIQLATKNKVASRVNLDNAACYDNRRRDDRSEFKSIA